MFFQSQPLRSCTWYKQDKSEQLSHTVSNGNCRLPPNCVFTNPPAIRLAVVTTVFMSVWSATSNSKPRAQQETRTEFVYKNAFHAWPSKPLHCYNSPKTWTGAVFTALFILDFCMTISDDESWLNSSVQTYMSSLFINPRNILFHFSWCISSTTFAIFTLETVISIPHLGYM